MARSGQAECRKDGPVWPGGAWPGELLAHDRDLMAQHEELGVLDACPRASTASQPRNVAPHRRDRQQP